MRSPLVFITFLLIFHTSVAQRTVSGYVRDANSGETLIGAAIMNLRTSGGTSANNYGYFSLKTNSDTISIQLSYVGYVRQRIDIITKKDTLLNIALVNANQLEEITINAGRVEDIQESSSMSKLNIPIEQIKALPSLFGERDVIKILQLLPGVQSGNEGSSGLYVRGGGPDQNLILLDGVPIYNASHLYGFFSTFNADAINHVEMYKGGFPARYGGRTSSVLDISMKEGNREKLTGQGTIGIISSKALIEGPINDKTSFLFSARRSYLNLLKSSLLSASTKAAADNYYLYDLNFKINSRINKKNSIYLSSYVGGDKAGSSLESRFDSEDGTTSYASTEESQIKWGNRIAAIRWNHVFRDWLFSNVTATYSKYYFETGADLTRSSENLASAQAMTNYYKYHYGSGIEDFTLKFDFDYTPHEGQYLKFGAGVIEHHFTPGVLGITSTSEIENQEYTTGKINATEFSAYVEDDMHVTKNFRVNVGLHSSLFSVQGESYNSIQPRVSARYLLNQSSSIKASYAMMTQFIHLLTNAGVGLPTDLWVPSTAQIKPQSSSQWALGYAKTFENKFELSIEAYHKTMNNLIEYKDGASYLSSDQDWQNKVEMGRGRSYGGEVFVQKKFGSFTGWFGYTLSWTNRQFDNLNNGHWFPYRYDRRHDVKIAIAYKRSEHWDFGVVWVYGSGNAVTVPLVSYRTPPVFGVFTDTSGGVPTWHGGVVDYAVSRNGFRMRAYHRLDLNAAYKFGKGKFKHEVGAGIYNAYGRKNPYYLGFDSTAKGRVLRQYNLFAFTPSLYYSIKF